MLRRTQHGRMLLGTALAVFATFLAGCGGGSGSSGHVQEPVVRNFSPLMSPIDFARLLQNPTFTNSALTVSTDPNYPGKLVIFFQDETRLDPTSVFTGGNPALGSDPAAIQVTREVPGSGNELIPIDITVEADRIICQPLPPYSAPDGAGGFITNLPDGQYTIGLLDGIRNTEGKGMPASPVFHSFTVGASDDLAPRVVTTTPVNGAEGIGAGTPPPAPPSHLPTESIAEVTTAIFGPTSPDIVLRFSEGIQSPSVTVGNIDVIDAGAPGAPAVAPAASFPKLKSEEDRSTLPSNGHEVIWRPDPTTGGLPFGAQVQVTVRGLWDTQATMDAAIAANPANPQADNAAPIQDLAGNFMTLSHVFQFATIRPPDLPQNPIPEYSVWWSASDRVGAVDAINHLDWSHELIGTKVFPQGRPLNVLPAFTDTVSTDQRIPNFDPLEIRVDARHGFLERCSTYVYVQSPENSQIAVINSENSVPVALISTPSPGGIAQTHIQALSTDMLVVTNSAANTFTVFALPGVLPGRPFLSAPIYITKVTGTGNTPRAVVVSQPSNDRTFSFHATWNQQGALNPGPTQPVIMWADFSDGAVNTITLQSEEPIKTLALGSASAPNDIVMSPCLGGQMFAAISEGGNGPNEGAVSYYVSGPGCQTGTQTPALPDAIVGRTQEALDAPDGIDMNAVAGSPGQPLGFGPMFIVAESGSIGNQITLLSIQIGQINLPRIVGRYTNVGDNPTSVAHLPSWTMPTVNDLNAPFHSSCIWQTLRFWQYVTTPTGIVPLFDGSYDPSAPLYVCSRGSGQITVVNMHNGARPLNGGVVPIPGIRYVGSQGSQ